MKKVQLTALYGAAIVMCGTAGFAQAPAQQATAAEQPTTVVGCVVREADYRRTADAGRGGVAGTGIGAGNEFVLINASAKAAGAATAASGAGAATATGTSGAATGSETSELTGPNEGQLQAHIGKRVEISGRMKPAEVGATGPTGGPTAGAPPTGVDVASKDLKLREFEVTSVREATGSCPAAPAAPAAR